MESSTLENDPENGTLLESGEVKGKCRCWICCRISQKFVKWLLLVFYAAGFLACVAVGAKDSELHVIYAFV